MRKALFLIALLIAGCGHIPTLDEVILRPNPTITQTPADSGYQYEEITLPVADDRSIVAWYIPSPQSKALVVLLPGSDANKGLYCEGIPVFNPFGYDILIADYEGFGSSPGTRSLQACLDDAYALIDYAQTRHSKVFVFGVSVGTPLAIRVAADHDLAGIVLEGTFNAKREAELWLKDNQLGFLPFWYIGNAYIYPQTPEGFDVLKYVQQVYEPKFFMHSPEDTVTPYDGAVEVFDAAPDPKDFWTMQGDHGRMIRLDPQEYIAHLIGWLDSH
jgi:fermentation-respiration switch protein FrsA (DUF1100 family)